MDRTNAITRFTEILKESAIEMEKAKATAKVAYQSAVKFWQADEALARMDK